MKKKQSIIILNTVFLVALLSLSLWGGQEKETTVEAGLSPDRYSQLMEEADAFYALRGNPVRALDAWKTYEEALKEKKDAYATLWKLAKTGFCLAEIIKDKKEKKRIVVAATNYAKKAVKVNPEGVEGHFWLGVNYTKYGEVKGVLKALSLIKPTKREMRTVIRLDETYEGGGAYVVLGRVFSQVPGILGGSNKKARKHFEKALEISPNNSMNLMFLAETYWDLKLRKKAIDTLETLLALEPAPQWIPETRRHQKEARKMLKKYRAKK